MSIVEFSTLESMGKTVSVKICDNKSNVAPPIVQLVPLVTVAAA